MLGSMRDVALQICLSLTFRRRCMLCDGLKLCIFIVCNLITSSYIAASSSCYIQKEKTDRWYFACARIVRPAPEKQNLLPRPK